VNHLADNASSPSGVAERQSTLDARVRSRIDTELLRLREEEEQVRKEIEVALEKENIDHELHGSTQDPATEEEGSERVSLHSVTLLGDVEEIRQKVDKFHSKHVELDLAGQAAQDLVQCYRNQPGRALDCWQQVTEFKSSVAKMEQEYINTLR